MVSCPVQTDFPARTPTRVFFRMSLDIYENNLKASFFRGAGKEKFKKP